MIFPDKSSILGDTPDYGNHEPPHKMARPQTDLDFSTATASRSLATPRSCSSKRRFRLRREETK